MKKLLRCLCISLIVFPMLAHADFRKALDSLQRIDGVAMMVEVQDAVKTKNNDGLSLFLPTLSTKFKDGEFYIRQRTGKNFYMNDGDVSYKLLLGEEYIPELIGYLDNAVNLSNDKDSQDALNYLKKQIAPPVKSPPSPNSRSPTRESWLSDIKERVLNGEKYAIHLLASEVIVSESMIIDSANVGWVEKSAELGGKDSMLWLASLYLHGNYYYGSYPLSITKYQQIISPDNKKGMYWLIKSAVPPSANSFTACKVADAYYSGDKLNKNVQEAFLWYIEANPRLNDCAAKGLRIMADANNLARFNPDLSIALKKNDQKNLYDLFWKIMQNTKRPTDIRVALREQFEVNKTTRQPVYSVEDTYYQLYLFADGKVEYKSTGGYITGKDDWKIPKDSVSKFLKALETTGIYYGRNEVESVACDMGERWRYGKIFTVKNKQPFLVEYTTVRHTFYNPITAKIFKVQETFIPTQHLRCGSEREDNDYKNCVAADKVTFENADKANNTK